jgi:hypothetical protein
MAVSEIDLYEHQLGQEKAKTIVQYVEAKVDRRLEEKKSEFILERDKDKLLTKADAIMIFASKEDIAKDMGRLEIKIAESEARMTMRMFYFWIGQVAAIAGLLVYFFKFGR